MKKRILAVGIAVVCVQSLHATNAAKAVLQVPEHVHAGETFTVKLAYKSTKTENAMGAPIFEVVSTGQVFHVSGNTYTNRAWVLGLSSDEATPGKLAVKEQGEISFSVTAGNGSIAWNVILHSSDLASKPQQAAFPLDRFFNPRWFAEQKAANSACYTYLKKNIGVTWATFYEKFDDYLKGDYPIVYTDFWKTAAVFIQSVYFAHLESTSGTRALSQAAPIASRSLTAAGNDCSHKSSAPDVSESSTDSYDGTVWWYCPSCKKWRLCLKGAFQDEGDLTIYEDSLDWNQPVYVITIDSESKLQTAGKNYQILADALVDKGMVLGVCWTYGGSRNIPAKSVDHAADTVVRHLKLLNADPTKITFIGTGYGAHVAANAIASYEIDSGDARSFARLVALDPLTTDYAVLSESVQASTNLYALATGKCSQVEVYRSSWSRSLTRADQLFGHYNFALWPEEGFYPKTLGNEWSRSDEALSWFIRTVTNQSEYADLGFNFNGASSWETLSGMTELPPAGTFAGLIDGQYLELIGSAYKSGSYDRYFETMCASGTETNAMETLFNRIAGTIDYAVDVETDATLDASGKTLTFPIFNYADNLAIPFTSLSNFYPQAIYPWRRGFSIGAWLVDVTALKGKGATDADTLDANELVSLLRSNGWESLARCIGEMRVDDPVRFVLPFDGASFDLPLRVRNDCFGSDAPLVATDGTKRETALLLAAGVTAGSVTLPSVYAYDLNEGDNFALLEATPAVVPFFVELTLGGNKVTQGASMDIAADAAGSWSAALTGGQTEDIDGNTLTYTFDIQASTDGCTSTVTSDGTTGTATGQLADDLTEGRYNVTVTAANGNGESDTLTFTLVVTRDFTGPGDSIDTTTTSQDGSLVAYIQMPMPETPEITWAENLPGRTYTVKGKVSLDDAEWVSPTNSTHRFFKVFADPAPVLERTFD